MASIRGVTVTPPASSRRRAGAKGPQRDPTTVISPTTSLVRSRRAGPAKVLLRTRVPSGRTSRSAWTNPAEHGDAGAAQGQYLGHQQPQPAGTDHGRFRIWSHRYLLPDAQRRSERLGEDGRFVWQLRRHAVQISHRQRQVVGKGTVPVVVEPDGNVIEDKGTCTLKEREFNYEDYFE